MQGHRKQLQAFSFKQNKRRRQHSHFYPHWWSTLFCFPFKPLSFNTPSIQAVLKIFFSMIVHEHGRMWLPQLQRGHSCINLGTHSMCSKCVHSITCRTHSGQRVINAKQSLHFIENPMAVSRYCPSLKHLPLLDMSTLPEVNIIRLFLRIHMS